MFNIFVGNNSIIFGHIWEIRALFVRFTKNCSDVRVNLYIESIGYILNGVIQYIMSPYFYRHFDCLRRHCLYIYIYFFFWEVWLRYWLCCVAFFARCPEFVRSSVYLNGHRKLSIWKRATFSSFHIHISRIENTQHSNVPPKSRQSEFRCFGTHTHAHTYRRMRAKFSSETI